MRTLFFAILILFGSVSMSLSQNSPEYYLRRCQYLSPKMESMIGINVEDDVFKSNLSNIIENRGENFITIRTSKVSTLSVGVLRMVNNSDVVVMLFTVESPLKCSVIRFFNDQLKLLPGDKMMDNIDLKTIIDNLSCNNNIKKRIEQLISPLHISYKFENKQLKAEIGFPTTIEDEKDKGLMQEIDKIKQYTYDWNSFKYVIKK